jgi:hypothetical protein
MDQENNEDLLVEQFVSQYMGDGINSVGFGVPDIAHLDAGAHSGIVVFALSQGVMNSLPDEFMGYPVYKRVSGKIIPL